LSNLNFIVITATKLIAFAILLSFKFMIQGRRDLNRQQVDMQHTEAADTFTYLGTELTL
jgi:hypothetical protein